jgi:hypothetical protein
MKRYHATTLIGIIGIAGGLMLQLVFPVGKVESATPTIKVPGAYPYEETVQIPTPAAVSEASVLPTPAPFPYPETSRSLSASHDRDLRPAYAHRALTATAVRKAAFKYNGVSNFCEFLAALPADVSVVDPTLGRTRTLVKGGHVQRKNAAWLSKRKQAPGESAERAVVSIEELGARNPGS